MDLYLGIVPSSSTTLVRKSVKDFDEFEGFDEFPNIFFHAHPPVEIFVPLNLNEKKKKKRKSLPARYLNLNSRNERDSTHKAREESLTSFRRYFIKYMADDVERERERETDSTSLIILH